MTRLNLEKGYSKRHINIIIHHHHLNLTLIDLAFLYPMMESEIVGTCRVCKWLLHPYDMIRIRNNPLLLSYIKEYHDVAFFLSLYLALKVGLTKAMGGAPPMSEYRSLEIMAIRHVYCLVCCNASVGVALLLTCICLHGRWLIGGLVFGLCRLHSSKRGVWSGEKSQPLPLLAGVVHNKPTTMHIQHHNNMQYRIKLIMRDIVARVVHVESSLYDLI